MHISDRIVIIDGSNAIRYGADSESSNDGLPLSVLLEIGIILQKLKSAA